MSVPFRMCTSWPPANNTILQQHPEWFMKDADGRPLPSNKVTFGGWRRGPWYALDCTQPAA